MAADERATSTWMQGFIRGWPWFSNRGRSQDAGARAAKRPLRLPAAAPPRILIRSHSARARVLIRECVQSLRRRVAPPILEHDLLSRQKHSSTLRPRSGSQSFPSLRDAGSRSRVAREMPASPSRTVDSSIHFHFESSESSPVRSANDRSSDTSENDRPASRSP